MATDPVALRTIGLLVTMLNVGLLIALAVLFLQGYRRMKTTFGLALVVLVVVMLLQNVLQVLNAFVRVKGGNAALGSLVLPDALEFVALLVLLYLATR